LASIISSEIFDIFNLDSSSNFKEFLTSVRLNFHQLFWQRGKQIF
jgi:hypothetical protein